jgi:uncharacterized protein YndB with AHSA1/START domain
MTGSGPSDELTMTQVFDAPRRRVYQAFVDPNRLAAWFGPVGYSIPLDTVDVDARVGGHQRFVMVSDQDPEFRSPVDATLTEVIENELLVGEETWTGSDDVMPAGTVLRLRLEFHEEFGKTRLLLWQGPYRSDILEMVREGWASSFTKLEALLYQR